MIATLLHKTKLQQRVDGIKGTFFDTTFYRAHCQLTCILVNRDARVTNDFTIFENHEQFQGKCIIDMYLHASK